MKYKLLVFDWDGTLMDSEARIVSCVKAAAEDIDVEPPPNDAIRNIIGLGLREAVDQLFPNRDDDFHQRLTSRYRLHFLDENKTPSPLFDGVDQVLKQLNEAGHLMAVATGKSRAGLNRVFESTGLSSYFHASRCADETFSKPHPGMLLEILDELGMDAVDALMIGDTEYDLEMAANAYMSSVGVTCGVHAEERLMKHRPLACLASVTDLPYWLNNSL